MTGALRLDCVEAAAQLCLDPIAMTADILQCRLCGSGQTPISSLMSKGGRPASGSERRMLVSWVCDGSALSCPQLSPLVLPHAGAGLYIGHRSLCDFPRR